MRGRTGQGDGAAATPPSGDDDLLAALLTGDETAFREVVEAWSPGMLRLARLHVSTDASAQEVVQDTWLAVLRGLDRFEGRSLLHTWTLRILVNTAKTRGVREGRVEPRDAAWDSDGDDGPTVSPDRFRRSPQQWARHWTDEGAPARWDADPSHAPMREEVRLLLESALQTLPPRQRDVLVLHDVQGLDAAEVCEVLGLTPQNQRVLLHRARAKVRALLEDYYRSGP